MFRHTMLSYCHSFCEMVKASSDMLEEAIAYRKPAFVMQNWILLVVIVGMGVVGLTFAFLPSDRSSVILNQTNVNEALVQNTTPEVLSQHWIITAPEALAVLQTGASLIDARGLGNPLREHLQGSVSAQWQDFSQSDSDQRGNLIDNLTLLEEKVRKLGISNDKPVIVFGNPAHGWGEEGRIVWMLRTLGHDQAMFVDGGIQALIDAGAATSSAVTRRASIEPGNFKVERDDQWHIERDMVKQALNHKRTILLDTREEREYQGQTPYGEQRGGHLPGAIHLYFKELLAPDGRLLPRDELMQILRVKDISLDTDIIAYCTGGVRSAWVTAVLNDLGFSVKNYAGSTWEWSASPEEEYPLIAD